MRHLVKVTVVGLSLFTLVACKNPKPTARIDRSKKATENKTGGAGVAQKILAKSARCLDLPGFKAMATNEISTMVVYTQDVDLVERDACKFFSADVTSSARRIALLEQIKVHPYSASELMTGTPALAATKQDECLSVAFEDGSNFKVDCAADTNTQGRLFLKNADETEFRIYTLDATSLTLETYTRVAAIEECAGMKAPAKPTYKKIVTKMTLTENVATARLRTSFLDAITGTVKKTPKYVSDVLSRASTKNAKGNSAQEVDINLMSLLNLAESSKRENVCPK